MRHKGGHKGHKGGGGKSRGFKHKGGGPSVAGHIMTPDQEREDRMANRAANQGGNSPFDAGGPMAGPAPAAIAAGPQPGPPGQQMPAGPQPSGLGQGDSDSDWA